MVYFMRMILRYWPCGKVMYSFGLTYDCLKIVWDRTSLKPENRSRQEIKSASPHYLVIFNLGFVLEVIKIFTQK